MTTEHNWYDGKTECNSCDDGVTNRGTVDEWSCYECYGSGWVYIKEEIHVVVKKQ